MSENAYPKVETWVDITALEHEVLDFWEKSDAFNLLREKNRGKEPWSFLDGPITANNPMGVHHAWGRTLKDTFQRYWAMNGRELRYQNGFDCQGLWVEVEVEKEHGFGTKREIESYGVEKFVQDCKDRVVKYSGIQTEQSIRMGMWMDWDNSYFTMSEENNYTIWSFLKKCHERGKVYRGHDVVPWSGRSGSSYSQMEIIEGRKLVAHTAVFIKFPLRDREKENLLVWTTTPWTLSSNVAAAVNVDLEYAKCRCLKDGEVYYFAAENLNFQRLKTQWEEKKEWIEGVARLKTIHEIFTEMGGYEIEGLVKGADLVGLAYDGPFDSFPAQNVAGGHPVPAEGVTQTAKEAHRVIDGGRDFKGNAMVVLGEGTGIVHIAPGCGDVDHTIGKQQGLPQVAPLDAEANFVEGFDYQTGRNASDRDLAKEIIRDMKDRGVLVHQEQYPHIYPHCWRSGDELVFRMVDEWYINMDWRQEIIDLVGKIQWIPGYGHDRELEWLTNMRDWMISKKRYWGLALPIWVCEGCDHFDVIGSREELKERAIEGWDEFEGHTPHRPHIDKVKIKCAKCGGTASRIPDVGNPWLDAGIVTFSTMGWNTDREHWAKWAPADLVLECFPGQFRNWFYALLSMDAMMLHGTEWEGQPPFKTLVGHALVRDENGDAMHKSTGNAIWFEDAAEQAGADTMRWLYVNHDPTLNLNFGFGPLKEVRGGFINQVWNTHAFFVNYARLEGFDPSATPTPVAERPDFDRWILSELQSTIEDVRRGVESYDIRLAAQSIERFAENLSNWHIRHNRPRFYKTKDEADKRMAFETLHECLFALIRLAAPMIPFLTEKMYQNLIVAVDPGAPVSVHLTDFPVVDESKREAEITEHMRAIMRLNSIALAARDASKIKVRQPLAKMTISPADSTEQAAAKRFESMLLEDLNVKAVEVLDPGAECPLSFTVKPNFKSLGKRLGAQMKAGAAAIDADAARLLTEFQAGRDTMQVEVEGETIELTKIDLKIESIQPEGLSIAQDRDTWVSFDTVLTEDLQTEGLMRDVLRKLQVSRKDAGLEIEDRITLRWTTTSPKIEKVFATFGEAMGAELLCTEVTRDDALDAKPFKIAGESMAAVVTKA